MGGFNLNTVVDSHGNAFTVDTAGAAYIGGVDQLMGFGTTDQRLFITASAGRSYIPTDYQAGDTIDLAWNFPSPGNIVNAAIAFATIGNTGAAAPQTFLGAGPSIEYGNGDSYPDVSLSDSTLDWAIDYGDSPVPSVDSMLMVAHASFPPQAAPFTGAGVPQGFVSNADFSFALALRALVSGGSAVNPFAIWPGSASMLVGNYQFVRLT